MWGEDEHDPVICFSLLLRAAVMSWGQACQLGHCMRSCVIRFGKRPIRTDAAVNSDVGISFS